ncbi:MULTISPECIES: hypothetical protein [Sphingobium]|jgi:hypothetical protein|uniref:Uncharacterized protein n=2 Tax=Sphingobium fuliginis (strain ATCC 27551) TaxID=336203 RepID=A0A292ZMS8_SPHSA|nr:MULTISPECIES: hypothetical protein [Sphingobium]OAP33549.1 hypothetical protein A8O16_03575 [Sphingobium sp. 20006FA]AJR23542.1 hypothetical protein TZ53_07195 [Sphingobium sp. YBL2]KXU33871.1 hypothetical protein AXW74_00905 [Sphingobium sp. AM]KYC33815.1 hypothetical protein A0J57_04355 [Sphingobium sp. 22B]MCB4862684.1 hypothetical protein [Sphingobium sp. PNB]
MSDHKNALIRSIVKRAAAENLEISFTTPPFWSPVSRGNAAAILNAIQQHQPSHCVMRRSNGDKVGSVLLRR